MTCKEYHSKDVKVKVKLNCMLNIYTIDLPILQNRVF